MSPSTLYGWTSMLAGLASVLGLYVALFWGWTAISPLALDEVHPAWTRFFVWSAFFLVSVLTGVAALIMGARRGGITRLRIAFIAGIVALAAVGVGVWGSLRRWELRLAGVPSMYDLPVDSTGYTIEKLPFVFLASFARGQAVYFADPDGRIFRADDRDPAGTRVEIGRSGIRPRMLFVSSRGAVFVSGDDQPMVRSADGGKTWEKCMDWSFWRMDEDEQTGTLYAGNYSRRNDPAFRAAVFKSTDEGKTWQRVFTDDRLDHVHTTRYDPKYKRIYIATGDVGKYRGQLFSPDGGGTWKRILSGVKQGCTDAAISEACVFWGSDDGLGRVVRARRETPESGQNVLRCVGHQVWFVVAEGLQVYVGTYVQDVKLPGPAFLMASSDEGRTWRKLMEHDKPRADVRGLIGESRRLSAGRWLYFTADGGASYRVRKTPSEASGASP